MLGRNNVKFETELREICLYIFTPHLFWNIDPMVDRVFGLIFDYEGLEEGNKLFLILKLVWLCKGLECLKWRQRNVRDFEEICISASSIPEVNCRQPILSNENLFPKQVPDLKPLENKFSLRFLSTLVNLDSLLLGIEPWKRYLSAKLNN